MKIKNLVVLGMVGLLAAVSMAAYGRYCCKTILNAPWRNLDSTNQFAAHD